MEIKMSTFYKVGIACFSIIFLMGLINFAIYFNVNNVFSKISSLATLVFNFVLILVFKTLLGSVAQAEGSGSEELKELMEGFK